jgi:hypothetical protein
MNQTPKTIFGLFLLLSLGFFSACGPKTDQAGEGTAEDSTSQETDPWANAELVEPAPPQLPLADQLVALNDSVNTTWYLLVKSDEAKLANILKLADQMAKLPKHKTTTLDSVRSLHKKLAANKLTWDNLTNTGLVDAYFNDFDELIRKVKNLNATTLGAESCTVCTDLIGQIDIAYGDDASYIYRYNQYASELNGLIKNQQDSIKILGDKYLAIKQRPVFPDPPVQ